MGLSRRSLLTAGATLPFVGSARAQTARAPVRIVFPFGAGGTGDALCRHLADAIAKASGRAVIVENRTGADGRIGIQAVKAAPADGDTVLVTTGPTMALMPQIHKAPGYDPVADFAPVSHIARFEFCIVAANATGLATLADLAAWAKANPDRATYAVPGLGTIPHFAGVRISRMIGVEMRRLAYRGGAPAMNDLVGGQIPLGVMTLSDALQQYRGGLVRMLATLGEARSPFVSQVPTAIEQGYAISGDAWYGMWAPGGTPAAAISALNAAVVSAVSGPQGRERLMDWGLIATGSTPAELAEIRRRMADDWAPTIRESGFTLEQ